MRALVWLAVLWLGIAPALAQAPSVPVSPGDRDAIIRVIRDQMAAFRRDDAPAAFGFAAPGIRGLFGQDPNRFLDMVRNAYQPVYRPRDTAFGQTEAVDGQIIQRVEIEGPDGVNRTALYTMEHEPDGNWRISACVLLDTGDAGA